jgi:CO/xanthine dehydrogenase FAD-binding subunit
VKYHQAQDLDSLQHLLTEYGGNMHLLAGGTDFMVELRQPHFEAREHIIDISGLQEIRGIKEDGSYINIGAAVTHDMIVHNELVREYAALLSAACRKIGSQQVRNRGTIGGNICNASPCADTVPALIALDAELTILSADGVRKTPIADFFYKPYQPKIEAGEAVVNIRFKKLNKDQRSAFIKLGRRNAVAISRISIAAVLSVDSQNTVKEVRIAPGSVFPSWRRITEAETFLSGREAIEKNFEEAGKITARKMIEISGRRWSTDYKEPVTASLIKRTLLMALNNIK